jgi:predicted nucleic acid-binding protein
VWYYRGRESARDIILKNKPFFLCAVNYMELLQGVRDKNELQMLQKDIKHWQVSILLINEKITERAISLVEDYHLSHNMEMADALIASTALEYGESILTANNKHYNFIPNLEITIFRP